MSISYVFEHSNNFDVVIFASQLQDIKSKFIKFLLLLATPKYVIRCTNKYISQRSVSPTTAIDIITMSIDFDCSFWNWFWLFFLKFHFFLVVHACLLSSLFLLLCFEYSTLFTYQHCDIPDTTMMVYKNPAHNSHSFQHHLDKSSTLFILKLSLLNTSFWPYQDIQGQYWLDQWNVECQWYLVNG